MLDLNDVALFVEVVRQGSFAAAARQLDVPANTLSRRVQQLEDRVGTRLMHRSTRQLALTRAGETFFERCAKQVDELVSVSRDLMNDSAQAVGLVRVAAPADFFEYFRMSWVAEFLADHPKVRFDFVLSEGKIDLISDRVDIAFRAGTLEDSGYVGRQLVQPSRNGLVASPAYLAACGNPSSLEEIKGHHVVSFPHSSGFATWSMSSAQESSVQVRVPIRVSGNTIQMQKSAALDSLGIALLPLPTTRDEVASGLLVPVLPNYWCSGYGINVLYPSRKHRPVAVSEFIDMVALRLSVPQAQGDMDGHQELRSLVG